MNNLNFKNITEELLGTFLEAGDVAKNISNTKPQIQKKKIVEKKVQKWIGVQVIKAILGIPSMPAME